MNIVGISAYFHDSSCCLLQDGKLVAALSEERLSRFKNDARLPVRAFRYCLEAGGIDVADIDCVAYYELPKLKLSRQLASRIPVDADPSLSWLDAMKPEREIREVLGVEAPIRYFSHHLSHAASSFLYSGFEDAAILTVDGVGEWATCSYALGEGSKISPLASVDYPHSLGLLYSTITNFLGFEVLEGEYKVMGLAPYGEPRFADKLRKLVELGPDGQFRLDLRYFDFRQRDRMYTEALTELLGVPHRRPEAEMGQVHSDIAKSLQQVLEEVLLGQVRYLAQHSKSKNLCMGGGVALNCVANGKILREGPFQQLFVQPAAGDAGSALGAAALAHVELTGARHTTKALSHVYLGPEHNSDDVAYLLGRLGLEAQDYRGKESALIDAVVEQLAAGKVIGWFDGRTEFGPRSLGARSILADPRRSEMRDHINQLVKKREEFRPFAPAILETCASEHMDLDHASPFMLEVCQVASALSLPAITHVDGSCRPQTVSHETSPRFAALLQAFYAKTGCPILLNTSFNVRGEPIVTSPLDAIRCFGGSGIECLVLTDFILTRDALPEMFSTFAEVAMPRPWVDIFSKQATDSVYTFI
jgi:carbamoyltransferase